MGNRLINEKSPYLLQHAGNPVDWYPWGEEAFAKAKLEDKPVFLSIGYSTCHWCHVMERESFEDKEVAALLNEKYIAIKVDREERPDIDNLYMRACQALTGAGGWPLTVLLTADKRAFFAGTYFPKHQQYGRMGLLELLAAAGEAWREKRAALLGQSDAVTKAVLRMGAPPAAKAAVVTKEMTEQAYRNLLYNFDSAYGGFGDAPKFPTPHNLLFLLRYWHETGQKKALAMVEKTLLSMWNGGIYDHLGGGFSRYSTDRKWLVPHFEKMLYDNALLMLAYAEAYQCTKKEVYGDVVSAIVEYVKREMMHSDGGFYSAEDADAEGVEGKYYVFCREEIIEALGKEDGEVFCAYYGVTDDGNFEGANILHMIGLDRVALLKKYALNEAELAAVLARGKAGLLAVRSRRVRPHKDDKILTSWNGLMIAALATAGRIFAEPLYLAMAKKAVRFIEENIMRRDRIYVRYRAGETAVLGFIDEYAFLLWAYLELYETGYAEEFLRKARQVADEMRRLFFDEENGGFYFSGVDGEMLFGRQKEIYDGAIPSGNSVAAWNLLRLAVLTGEQSYHEMAEKTLTFFAEQADSIPEAYTFYQMAAMQYLRPFDKIVVAGEKESAGVKRILTKLQGKFLPDSVILYEESQVGKSDVTVQFCRNLSCLPPLEENMAMQEIDKM